ncbi:zinc metalloproteinase-disintegrin-like NaMP isoform X2 [Haliotis rufescens]|uniref:zinc metalloproteinase-disintegrin-like NaMP isoform X2 n=1 Tax=Haliotis rufescens TaxID=6454 RepID=UPI00201F5278|nr:zinc metalloproteinase-disintegrin-like NaMP isoform X2 [Haliotis rufescens]
MVPTLTFLTGLSICLLVSGTGQIAKVDLMTPSEDIRQTCVLPNKVKVAITSENKTVHLNLKKNEHVDHEAPVFVIRHDEGGRAHATQEPTLELQGLGMFQDRDKGAAMKVSCKRRQRQDIQIQLEGRFVHPSGKLYHLAPLQSPLKTDFQFEKGNMHEMTTTDQLFHATDRAGLFVDRRQKKASATPDSRTVDIDTTTFQIDILAYVDCLEFQRWMNISHQVTPALRRLDTIQRVKQAVALIMNDMNLRYKTVSPSFNIHLIGFMIEDTAEGGWFLSVNQREKDPSTVNGILLLDSFSNWTKTVQDFPKNDFTMIFTSHKMYRYEEDLLGISQTASVCKEGKGISIVKVDGSFMTNTRTASHELGHGLGAKHDGDGNTCKAEDQYIMSAKLKIDTSGHQFQFSSCSSTYFRHYLQGVLRDGTSYSVQCLTTSLTAINVSSTVQLPGQVYNIDDQCRNIKGPRSYFCRWCYGGTCVPSVLAPSKYDTCVFGDTVKTVNKNQTCSEFITTKNRYYCYNDNNYRLCCGTCESITSPDKDCRWGNNYWTVNSCDEDKCNSTINGAMYYDICCQTCAFMRPAPTSLPTSSATGLTSPGTNLPTSSTKNPVNTNVGTTTSTSHYQAGCLSCPDDWVAHDGSCYSFVTSQKTWSEAMTSCQASGANLVSIETSAENEFLKKFLLRFSTCSSGWSSWVGGTDKLVEGQWLWSNTGRTVSYTDWGDNQPDNGQSSSNDCMLMCFSEKYRWGGEDCGTKQSSICEKKLSPLQVPLVG